MRSGGGDELVLLGEANPRGLEGSRTGSARDQDGSGSDRRAAHAAGCEGKFSNCRWRVWGGTRRSGISERVLALGNSP